MQAKLKYVFLVHW